MKSLLNIISCVIILSSSSRSDAQSRQQRLNVLDRIAHTNYHPTFSACAASILLGFESKHAYAQLDTLLDREYGDMFWMYGCAGLYFSCKDVLPKAYKEKIRSCWKLFTPYRGDTENHFLMYYGSLFLMTEEWDSLPASEWFMGRSSKEIRTESREWLLHWFDETAKNGMSEFDSPRYLYYYITPLGILAAYSRDAVIRQRAHMMLEYLLANYAVKYSGGSYVGAHSREGEGAATSPITAEVVSYGEYFFEDSVRHMLPDLAFLAASDVQISPMIRAIAHNNGGYVCTEMVRSRRRIRYETPAVKHVRKYTYIAKDFALGSIESGIVQPIQQRSWSLVLRSDEKYNAIIGLHPYSSAKELGTYFPEEPSFMYEKIEAVKNGYTGEDKWVGASPYETMWQRQNELHCSYDVPKDEPVRHIDLFLPSWGKFVDVDSTVWHQLVVRYGGVTITIKTSSDYTITDETGGFRLRMKLIKGKGDFWLYVNDGFAGGGIDRYTFSGASALEDPELPTWLIASPFLRSAYGSGIITITLGGRKHILDFTKGVVYDR